MQNVRGLFPAVLPPGRSGVFGGLEGGDVGDVAGDHVIAPAVLRGADRCLGGDVAVAPQGPGVGWHDVAAALHARQCCSTAERILPSLEKPTRGLSKVVRPRTVKPLATAGVASAAP